METQTQSNQAQETHLVYAFPKSQDEKIQIAVRKFRGKYYVDVRLWFQDRSAKIFLPSKKGVFFPLDQAGELRKGAESLMKITEKLKFMHSSDL